MLDSAPLAPTVIFENQAPARRWDWMASISIAPNVWASSGFGETRTDALFDLVETLLRNDQPAEYIIAAIHSAEDSAELCGLIDWIGGK